MGIGSKNKKCLAIAVVLLIVIIVGGFYATVWITNKMVKVREGLAEPTFPYRDYAPDQINKNNP
jgi:flagellar basal body-associated protein FliL